MIRTTTNGTSGSPAYRYTAGQPDSLYTPNGGNVPGKPPIIFMTGGGTRANVDPAGINMDVHLVGITAAGMTVMQPDVPWLGGNDLAMTRIQDAANWGYANLGCVGDPIVIGISNGWACAILYARQYPITGIVGILPVVAGKDGYLSDDAAIRAMGIRERIETAWSVTYPTLPVAKFSPYDDVANYPDLRNKAQLWYAAGDALFVSEQMAFGARIGAEMHNVGAYGHLGDVNDLGAPVAHVTTATMVNFLLGLL